MTTNNKINAAISIFIRIHFRCSNTSVSSTFKCWKYVSIYTFRCWKYVSIVRFSACKNVSKCTFYRTTFYVKYIRIIMRSRWCVRLWKQRSLHIATSLSPTRARGYSLNINPKPESISGPVGLGSGSRPLVLPRLWHLYLYPLIIIKVQ